MKRYPNHLVVGALVAIAVAMSSCGDDSSTNAAAGSPSKDTDAAPATPATTSDSTLESGASSTTAAASSQGGQFSVSIGEPAAIDPALMQEVEGIQVTRLLVETLISLDSEMQLVPGVATEWAVADDGVTWTFVLRDDARYSDGEPVVAADFVHAFARSADPDLGAVSAYQGLPIAGWSDVSDAEPSGGIADVPVSGVRAVDDHTLEVVTGEPFSLLPKVLTYPIFAPVRAELVDTAEKSAAFAEQPIGNGPYRMVGPWEHNRSIVVERNPEYHGTPGSADVIEFRIYSDVSTAYRDFQAGELDLVRTPPSDQLEAARDEYGDQLIETPTASLYYIGFPTSLPPFDDPAMRRALSLAIDREAITDRAAQGSMDPATGMLPPQVPGAIQGGCDACRYDPDQARELYAAAGGEPGDTVVLYDISDDGQTLLEPIINSWREVLGLEVELRSYEFAAYLEETTADRLEGPFELGWVWDYPSGYSILSPLFETTSGANNLGWSDPAFDAAMASARAAHDEDAAQEFLVEGQRIAEAALPLAPIGFTSDFGIHTERLGNVHNDVAALWHLERIEVLD